MIRFLALSGVALIAQAPPLTEWSQFGVAGLALGLASWIIWDQRRDARSKDEIILTQLVPLVTESTVAIRASSDAGVKQQEAMRDMLIKMQDLLLRVELRAEIIDGLKGELEAVRAELETANIRLQRTMDGR